MTRKSCEPGQSRSSGRDHAAENGATKKECKLAELRSFEDKVRISNTRSDSNELTPAGKEEVICITWPSKNTITNDEALIVEPVVNLKILKDKEFKTSLIDFYLREDSSTSPGKTKPREKIGKYVFNGRKLKLGIKTNKIYGCHVIRQNPMSAHATPVEDIFLADDYHQNMDKSYKYTCGKGKFDLKEIENNGGHVDTCKEKRRQKQTEEYDDLFDIKTCCDEDTKVRSERKNRTMDKSCKYTCGKGKCNLKEIETNEDHIKTSFDEDTKVRSDCQIRKFNSKICGKGKFNPKEIENNGGHADTCKEKRREKQTEEYDDLFDISFDEDTKVGSDCQIRKFNSKICGKGKSNLKEIENNEDTCKERRREKQTEECDDQINISFDEDTNVGSDCKIRTFKLHAFNVGGTSGKKSATCRKAVSSTSSETTTKVTDIDDVPVKGILKKSTKGKARTDSKMVKLSEVTIYHEPSLPFEKNDNVTKYDEYQSGQANNKHEPTLCKNITKDNGNGERKNGKIAKISHPTDIARPKNYHDRRLEKSGRVDKTDEYCRSSVKDMVKSIDSFIENQTAKRTDRDRNRERRKRRSSRERQCTSTLEDTMGHRWRDTDKVARHCRSRNTKSSKDHNEFSKSEEEKDKSIVNVRKQEYDGSCGHRRRIKRNKSSENQHKEIECGVVYDSGTPALEKQLKKEQSSCTLTINRTKSMSTCTLTNSDINMSCSPRQKHRKCRCARKFHDKRCTGKSEKNICRKSSCESSETLKTVEIEPYKTRNKSQREIHGENQQLSKKDCRPCTSQTRSEQSKSRSRKHEKCPSSPEPTEKERSSTKPSFYTCPTRNVSNDDCKSKQETDFTETKKHCFCSCEPRSERSTSRSRSHEKCSSSPEPTEKERSSTKTSFYTCPTRKVSNDDCKSKLIVCTKETDCKEKQNHVANEKGKFDTKPMRGILKHVKQKSDKNYRDNFDNINSYGKYCVSNDNYAYKTDEENFNSSSETFLISTSKSEISSFLNLNQPLNQSRSINLVLKSSLESVNEFEVKEFKQEIGDTKRNMKNRCNKNNHKAPNKPTDCCKLYEFLQEIKEKNDKIVTKEPNSKCKEEEEKKMKISVNPDEAKSKCSTQRNILREVRRKRKENCYENLITNDKIESENKHGKYTDKSKTKKEKGMTEYVKKCIGDNLEIASEANTDKSKTKKEKGMTEYVKKCIGDNLEIASEANTDKSKTKKEKDMTEYVKKCIGDNVEIASDAKSELCTKIEPPAEVMDEHKPVQYLIQQREKSIQSSQGSKTDHTKNVNEINQPNLITHDAKCETNKTPQERDTGEDKTEDARVQIITRPASTTSSIADHPTDTGAPSEGCFSIFNIDNFDVKIALTHSKRSMKNNSSEELEVISMSNESLRVGQNKLKEKYDTTHHENTKCKYFKNRNKREERNTKKIEEIKLKLFTQPSSHVKKAKEIFDRSTTTVRGNSTKISPRRRNENENANEFKNKYESITGKSKPPEQEYEKFLEEIILNRKKILGSHKSVTTTKADENNARRTSEYIDTEKNEASSSKSKANSQYDTIYAAFTQEIRYPQSRIMVNESKHEAMECLTTACNTFEHQQCDRKRGAREMKQEDKPHIKKAGPSNITDSLFEFLYPLKETVAEHAVKDSDNNKNNHPGPIDRAFNTVYEELSKYFASQQSFPETILNAIEPNMSEDLTRACHHYHQTFIATSVYEQTAFALSVQKPYSEMLLSQTLREYQQQETRLQDFILGQQVNHKHFSQQLAQEKPSVENMTVASGYNTSQKGERKRLVRCVRKDERKRKFLFDKIIGGYK